MKKIAILFLSVLVLIANAAPLQAQFKDINDEFAFNKSEMLLQLHIVVPQNANSAKMHSMAVKQYGDFLVNLNLVESDDKVKNLLAARPVLDAKFKAAIVNNTDRKKFTAIDEKNYLVTFWLNFKAIRELIPEIEVPFSNE